MPDDVPSEVQHVVTCSRCGCCYTDSTHSQAAYDTLYAARSRYAAGPAAHTTDSERDVQRFREVAQFVSSHVPDRNARIADIGCANGQLLVELQACGFNRLVGVDPSADCVSEVCRRGIHGIVGSFSALPTELDGCQLVVLSHVLEHVRDVSESLRLLKRRMTVNALLYVEVPDAARYADYAWSPLQDFNSEHINHFSAHSLTTLLEATGFNVDILETKEILSAPGMPYPALYALARSTDVAKRVVAPDMELRGHLERYVTDSLQKLAAIDTRLRASFMVDQPILVWGTGELTSKLLDRTVLGQATIAAFADSNPINQGRTIGGKPVVAPERLSSSSMPIVISSILHAPAIAERIRAMNLTNPVVTLLPLG